MLKDIQIARLSEERNGGHSMSNSTASCDHYLSCSIIGPSIGR